MRKGIWAKGFFFFTFFLDNIPPWVSYLITSYFIEFEKLYSWPSVLHLFTYLLFNVFMFFFFLDHLLGRNNFDNFQPFAIFFFYSTTLTFIYSYLNFNRYWSFNLNTSNLQTDRNDFANLLWFFFCHYTLFNLQLLSLGHTW